MTNLSLMQNAPIFLCCFVLMLGACLGSFAALLIWRMPQGLSIVAPRSYCNVCQRPLKIWQNIPIFSWLILRGKCFFCRAPIGFRSLVIEIIFAVAMLALYLKFGWGIAFIERIFFVFFLICLLYIDLDTFSLPLVLLFSLLLLACVTSIIYAIRPDFYVAPSKAHFFLKMLVYKYDAIFSFRNRLWGVFWGFLTLALLNMAATKCLRNCGRLEKDQWAMGWGDPLFAMAIGAFVGVSHIMLVLFLASALGSLLGIANRFFGSDEANISDIAAGALPYGPFLALAAMYAYLF